MYHYSNNIFKNTKTKVLPLVDKPFLTLLKEIFENIAKLEEIAGKKFGDKENPLLVSVRSGARASMPGMMDTILNLGLNDTTVEVLAKGKTVNAKSIMGIFSLDLAKPICLNIHAEENTDQIVNALACYII